MRWAIFPTGNSEAGQKCADAWAAAGWKVAVLIDADQDDVGCDRLFRESNYRGTGAAFNTMMRELDYDIVACVNDDMFPKKCGAYASLAVMLDSFDDLCGVIQPVGCYFDGNAHAATSPIIGSEYVHRFGPAWDERFYHLWGDALLRDLASKRGLFLESPELGIEHRHHTQKHPDTLPAEKRAKNNARHAADRELYERLSIDADVFPPSQKISAFMQK